MRILTNAEAQRICIDNLRLDSSSLDIETPEAIAASIRRVASFLCPCSSVHLINSVYEWQHSLVQDSNSFKARISEILELVIGYGDLIEQSEVLTNDVVMRGRVLYLQLPSFIWRGNSALLIGILPDDTPILPFALENRIEYCNQTRRIYQAIGEDLRGDFIQFELKELEINVWNKKGTIPESESPFGFIQKVKNLLKGNPGTLENLQILNSVKDVRYYRGRWERVTNQTGFFVTRRPQLYGNDLWCFTELQDGKAINLVDFPVLNKHSLGRDEAWRLQMAIDRSQGKSQVISVETASSTSGIIKFYSPIPTWAQRRLDNLGEPMATRDCLFSYKLPVKDMAEEIRFLEEILWLTPEY